MTTPIPGGGFQSLSVPKGKGKAIEIRRRQPIMTRPSAQTSVAERSWWRAKEISGSRGVVEKCQRAQRLSPLKVISQLYSAICRVEPRLTLRLEALIDQWRSGLDSELPVQKSWRGHSVTGHPTACCTLIPAFCIHDSGQPATESCRLSAQSNCSCLLVSVPDLPVNPKWCLKPVDRVIAMRRRGCPSALTSIGNFEAITIHHPSYLHARSMSVTIIWRPDTRADNAPVGGLAQSGTGHDPR